jgi:hypothetical protein
MAQPRTNYQLGIAILIVAGLIGALWWLARPKLDPRLVGTWRIEEVHDRVGVTFTFGLTFCFESDGTAELRATASPVRLLDWRISDEGHLVIEDRKPLVDKLDAAWDRVVRRFRGQPESRIGTYSDIREVTSDRIVLGVPGNPDGSAFRRIPTCASPD